jgi:hypothetical protein
MDNVILDYYRQQSAITDPGKYAYLFDELPDDVASLARIVQRLLITPFAVRLYGVQLSEIDNTEYGVRAIEKMIGRILAIEDSPLTHPREPRKRLGANCRNFAALLVSMLRHKGIPARERVGFAGYFRGPISYDHRITEYWGSTQERWILADAQIDEVRRKAIGIRFDTLNITPDDPFHLSGNVWLQARQNAVDPNSYGDGDTEVGMPFIRYALLHDFDALNKLEVLGCDAWGELILKPEPELTPDDLAFLDQVAGLCANPDKNFAALREVYAGSDYGRTMQSEAQKQLVVY